MKWNKNELIDQLIQLTNDHIVRSETLLNLSEKELNKRPSEKGWSILECVEHLNRYAEFYLPEIKSRISNSKHKDSSEIFTSGNLGNYFAKSMLPKEGMKTMKTFSDKDPAGSKLTKAVLNNFIEHLNHLNELLEKAREVDLKKTKTSITLVSWLKLRLGDTFRFVIHHHERHLVQAEKIV